MPTLRSLFASAAFAVAAASCTIQTGSSGSNQPPPMPPPQQQGPIGFEARMICEAECRRDDRCRGVPPPGTPACYQRCATLPVRQPPIWDIGWATNIARCLDGMACGHDLDERCIGPGPRMSQTHMACMQIGERFCEVYDGLTPATDAYAADCVRRGMGRQCLPPFDWK